MTQAADEPGAPEPGAPAGAEGEPEVEERQSTPFLVLQFFIFPMAIVAVCVTVFVIFGLIAAEGKGARQYLDEVRSGSANRRWQAAFELSRLLQSGSDPELADPAFVSQAVSTFREAERDDPRVRRYLAVALGRLGDPAAVPALLEAARGADDAETRIYSVWALGSIGDPQALEELLRLSSDSDPGLRKTALHALGPFATRPEVRDALAGALSDPVPDVRWNAAVALGRVGDARAAPALLRMLDRTDVERVEGITPPQVEEALLQAVAAAAALGDPSLRDALVVLRDSDPNLRVRESARLALEGAAVPAPSP